MRENKYNKKLLTGYQPYDIIYLARVKETTIESKKRFKKLLTKRNECDNINELSLKNNNKVP